jgi:LysM repeat protein
MRSRAFLACSALLSVVLFGCGTEADSGTPPGTTIKLGTPTYVTITLPPESTLPPPPPGAIVPIEQSYKVKSGDYLLAIAKTYCLDAQQIADYNGWVEGIDRQLQPGDTIKIPANACPPGGSASTVPPTETTITVPETTTTFNPAVGGTYVVQNGDTLSGIAANFGITVEAIVDANDWKNGVHHVIYEGLKIEIPPAG